LYGLNYTTTDYRDYRDYFFDNGLRRITRIANYSNYGNSFQKKIATNNFILLHFAIKTTVIIAKCFSQTPFPCDFFNETQNRTEKHQKFVF